MSTETRSRDGQINRYEFFTGGKHTHDFYDSKTGKMGSHGENSSKSDNRWLGHRSENDTCRGAK